MSLPTDSWFPNPLWSELPLFDRKGWMRMAFGEYAQSVNERAEPKDAQEEIYVGLEHLDPQCLHIRRWGKGSDVTGTKLRFRKGDIIFGRRRAYQRKLAVAEFDGICSAHAMVVRARPDKVLPEFLPFLMMSDRFMNRAVEISVGSLSPTINWTTLKLEEFDLPPLDQQRRIAEILWAVDKVHRENFRLSEDIDVLRRTRLIESFVEIADAPTVAARDAGEVQLGRQRAPQFTTGRFSKPYLRVVNVLDGELDLRDVQEMDFDERDFARFALRDGDILITEGDITGPQNVGRSAIYRGEIDNCCFQKTLLRFRPNSSLTPEFAHAALQKAFYAGELARIAVTTTVSHLTAERFEKFRFPVPDLDTQLRICRDLGPIDQARRAQAAKVQSWANAARAIRDSLLP